MRGVAAVTGATGFIGRVVVRRLLEDGWELRVLVRRAPPPGLLPAGATIVQGDVTERDAVRRLCEGARVVHHLAGRAHAVGASEAEHVRANVEGTQRVAGAALEAGVPRVVVYGTIAVYGPTDGLPPVDEDAPVRPRDAYARTKAAAERGALELLGDRALVLRLAAVYGPGQKGNYARLVQAIAARRYVPVGPGTNRRTVVFVDDVAAAAMLASIAAAPPHRVYNVTDGDVHRLRDIVAAIARCLGVRGPTRALPIAPVRILVRALDPISRFAPIPGSSTLAKYLEDVAVSGERLQRELGYRPSYDLASGWRRTVEALRDEGRLARP